MKFLINLALLAHWVKKLRAMQETQGRCPGGENDNPLKSSCLKIPMDRGAWQAIAHGLQESDMT